MPDATVVELRIHGVGGATPHVLLGERHPDDVVLLEQGHHTGLWARRRDPSVQAYVWGGLTSGSKLQALWVVLLPFTLVNVAGWMHPPASADARRQRQVRAIRALVTALGFTLTATWVLWLAVIGGDYLAYQAGRGLGSISGPAVLAVLAVGAGVALAGVAWRFWWPLLALGVATIAVAIALRTVGSPTVRAVGGAVAAQSVLALLAVIAGVSRRRFEDHVEPGGPTAGPRTLASDDDLRSPTFFARSQRGLGLLGGHLAVAGVTTALVALRAWDRASAGAPTLGFGSALVALGAVQFLIVLTLAGLSLGEWGKANLRWRFAGPAVAATMGLATTMAVFSGLALFVARRIGGVRTGAELALVDVFVLNLAVSAVVLVFGWLPYFLAPRRGEKGPVARQRRVALAFRNVDVVCTAGSAVLVVAGAIATAMRIDVHGPLAPWNWEVEADGGIGPLRAAGQWLLPFVVPALGGLIRLGARSLGTRRNVGNLWDVLTFWPRRFHPLAVRPYSERAVPELSGIVRRHVEAGRPVVVSAHSQGSVLAFAALAPLAAEDWSQQVALVTYGSPLHRLHSRFFPGYVGPAELGFVRTCLLDWHNFFRRTDHIGQAVFGRVGSGGAGLGGAGLGGAPGDEELPDPPPAPDGLLPPPDGRGSLEPDRAEARAIAGHNLYLHERRLKDWVADAKRRLR